MVRIPGPALPGSRVPVLASVVVLKLTTPFPFTDPLLVKLTFCRKEAVPPVFSAKMTAPEALVKEEPTLPLRLWAAVVWMSNKPLLTKEELVRAMLPDSQTVELLLVKTGLWTNVLSEKSVSPLL